MSAKRIASCRFCVSRALRAPISRSELPNHDLARYASPDVSARKSMLASAAILRVAGPCDWNDSCPDSSATSGLYTYEVVSIINSSPGQAGSSIGPGAGWGLSHPKQHDHALLTLLPTRSALIKRRCTGWVKSDGST